MLAAAFPSPKCGINTKNVPAPFSTFHGSNFLPYIVEIMQNVTGIDNLEAVGADEVGWAPSGGYLIGLSVEHKRSILINYPRSESGWVQLD